MTQEEPKSGGLRDIPPASFHLPPAPTGYRPCVGVALFNRSGLVFMATRLDNPDKSLWQMPQGGIDAGEDILAAAKRELREETGIAETSIAILAAPDEWLCYDIPADILSRLPWGKAYKGQAQAWVAARFTGDDREIDLEAHEPAEFSGWAWKNLAEAPGLTVPFKRDVYRAIVKKFSRFSTPPANP